MKKEIMITGVLIEMEDGTFKAYCPELELTGANESPEKAMEQVRVAALEHIKRTGFDNLQLNAVKCTKIKLMVDG